MLQVEQLPDGDRCGTVCPTRTLTLLFMHELMKLSVSELWTCVKNKGGADGGRGTFTRNRAHTAQFVFLPVLSYFLFIF